MQASDWQWTTPKDAWSFLTAALLAHKDPVDALAAYEAERRPKTAEIVRLNRLGGPERVIDLVSERAPNGFERLDDVATPEELAAIVRGYAGKAGFSKEAMTTPPSGRV
ncbi:MAG: hypothetical protein AAGB11_16705, partial [Pseudomonadota bacterium]